VGSSRGNPTDNCHPFSFLTDRLATGVADVPLFFAQYFLPAAMRAAQACRYLIYSEADFEVFRPAGATRCTDGGEIWRG